MAARRYFTGDKRIAKTRDKSRDRGDGSEHVDPYVVFRRDGWRCRLCGVRTRGMLRGTTALTAPELDHVVPLSRGGAHTYANTQCLCRQCNMKKGASYLDGSRRPHRRLIGWSRDLMKERGV